MSALNTEARAVYEYLYVPQNGQHVTGTIVVEIGGGKYRCTFNLDTSYAEQSLVKTDVFVKDSGWTTVLLQAGTENPVCAQYHAAKTVEELIARAQARRSGVLEVSIVAEMHRLCRFAAEINA